MHKPYGMPKSNLYVGSGVNWHKFCPKKPFQAAPETKPTTDSTMHKTSDKKNWDKL